MQVALAFPNRYFCLDVLSGNAQHGIIIITAQELVVFESNRKCPSGAPSNATQALIHNRRQYSNLGLAFDTSECVNYGN